MSEASETLSGSTWDVEQLLPTRCGRSSRPSASRGRVEDTLAAVTQAAAEELSDWAEELSESELRALRDPRNWVRPVVAVGAGGVATGALVLLELRRRGRQQERERPTGPCRRPALAALGRVASRDRAVRGARPPRRGRAGRAPGAARRRQPRRAGSRGSRRRPDREAPDRQRGVEGAERRARSGARRSRRRSSPSAPVAMWRRLSQALTRSTPERVFDRRRGCRRRRCRRSRRSRATKSTAPTSGRVEAGGAGGLHRRRL